MKCNKASVRKGYKKAKVVARFLGYPIGWLLPSLGDEKITQCHVVHPI